MKLISVLLCASLVTANDWMNDPGDVEYYKMPRLFDMDDYFACMSHPNGEYCMGTFAVVGAEDNEMILRMKEFTKYPYNFNHTQIHRGFCMENCRRGNDIKSDFISCVDQKIHEKYGLNVRLTTLDYCKSVNDPFREQDWMDVFFIVVFTVLLCLNIFGTMYDVLTNQKFKASIKGNDNLMAWSIRYNWQKINEKNTELEFVTQSGFLRIIGSCLVILAHVALTDLRGYLYNPRYLEKLSQHPVAVIFYNGNMITMIFTLMTSFLLAYKLSIDAMRHPDKKINLKMFPKLIGRRLIRILPLYYFVYGYTSTWLRYQATGPYWPQLVENEVEMCRKNMWPQLFFIYNIVGKFDKCMPHTWSLASDLQLYVLAAIICLYLARNKNAIRIVSYLLVTSVMFIFGTSYMFNFKAMFLILQPETMRNLFDGQDSVHQMYIAPWASAPASLLGILLGYLITSQIHIKDAKENEKTMKENADLGQIYPKKNEHEINIRRVNLRADKKTDDEINGNYINKLDANKNELYVVEKNCVKDLKINELNVKSAYMNGKESKGGIKKFTSYFERKKINNVILLLYLRSALYLCFVWIMVGYWMRGQTNTLLISTFNALERPVFVLLVCSIVYASVNRIDEVWWNLSSWSGWHVPSRLSLSAALVHWILNVVQVATRYQMTSFTIYDIVVDWVMTFFITYLISLPLTLMVEMPIGRCLQKLFSL